MAPGWKRYGTGKTISDAEETRIRFPSAKSDWGLAKVLAFF